MAHRSAAMNEGLTPRLPSNSRRLSGKRSKSVAAGANGTRSGSSVRSLTKKATCGRQKTAVAYQLPRDVVGGSTAGEKGPFTRSRSFFVA